ncbi:MAG: AAC(3) family N-acetyltransferase [Gemmatimonadota bacterium]|nr:AAC(3) family N-acetyltransferase [Gemmatimonadota bacterium]
MTDKKKKRKEYPPFTRELAVDSLSRVGLKKGDKVFVHSSLKDLAPAMQLLKLPNMGMPYLIEGLKEVVGPEGLLCFPTFSYCFATRKTGPTGTIWDRKKTPSRVGDMTNFFLKGRDVLRSDHPTHSVAAWGAGAEELVADQGWDSPSTLHRGGPWGRLCDWDFYIILIGTYMSTCTMVHAVEDWMGLPYLADAEAVILDENKDVRIVTVHGNPGGCREFYNLKETKLERAFQATDIYTTGKLCMADLTLFKARDFVRFLWQALLDDPWLLLHNDPDDEFCWKSGQAAEKHLAGFSEPCPW